MVDETKAASAMPTLEDWQHWTLVMGRAQQMLMEFWADSLKKDQPFPTWSPPAFGFGAEGAANDPMALMSAGAQAWAKGLETWGKMLGGVAAAPAAGEKDAALSTHPVHTDDRPSLADTGLDFSTLDQPLLHPRPEPREELRQMVRRQWHLAIHGQLEVGGREHRRCDA